MEPRWIAERFELFCGFFDFHGNTYKLAIDRGKQLFRWKLRTPRFRGALGSKPNRDCFGKARLQTFKGPSALRHDGGLSAISDPGVAKNTGGGNGYDGPKPFDRQQNRAP